MKSTMKFLLLISLIFGLIIANKAAVMRGTYKDSRYPGKCAVQDLILSSGEQAPYPNSSCGRILCRDNSAVIFHTCGPIVPPEGHTLGKIIDPTAPYPKCCEKHYIPIVDKH